MPFPFYPSESELQSLLTDAGLTASVLQCRMALAEAVGKWESMTSCPFLAENADSTRYYDMDGRTLDCGPYTSIASVSVGVTYDQTTGEAVDGIDLVRNVGYTATGRPIRSIQFARCHRPSSQSVKVVGKRGMVCEVPDDAYYAILKGAAASVYRTLRNAQTNGLSSLNIGAGDLAVVFADATKTVAATWEADFTEAARNPNYAQFNL